MLTGTRVAGDPATELAHYPSDPVAQAGREALAAELEILRTEAAGKMFGSPSATKGSNVARW